MRRLYDRCGHTSKFAKMSQNSRVEDLMVTVGLGTFVNGTSLPLILRCNTSRSTKKNFCNRVGKRTSISWNNIRPFTTMETHISGNLHHELRPLCKSSSGEERLKCYLPVPFGVFSWSSSTHQDLSGKPSRSSLPRDKLSSHPLVSPFLPGTGTD